MTASVGIANSAAAPILPPATAPKDSQPSNSNPGETSQPAASFQSAMRDVKDQADTSTVRSSPSKKADKDPSKPSKKTDPNDQTLAPAPVPAAEIRVLPLTFTLNLGTSSPDETVAPAPSPAASDSEKAGDPAKTATDVMPLQEELPEIFTSSVEDVPVNKDSKSDAMAFAARLSPAPQASMTASADAPAGALDATNGASRDTKTRQSALVIPSPKSSSPASAPQKYLPGGSVTEDAQASGEKGARTAPAEPAYKVNPAVATISSNSNPAPTAKPSPTPQSVATQAMQEPAMEPAAVSPASSHDFRVRIPDNQGGSLDVRFVENGGEVRVTVKTPDNNLAQTLRGQLNQLSQQLSAGGVQTELWQPGSDRSFSQNSQQESQNFGQGSGGNKREQDQQQESNRNKPRWLEELELSGGTR